MPNRKVCRIQEASCLRASEETVNIAIIQPYGELICDDEIGPHYEPGQAVDTDEKFMSFLNCAKENDSELIIAPEFFTPIISINNIIDDPSRLKQNSIYILPLESLSIEDYDNLCRNISENGYILVKTDFERREGFYINCCAIILRNRQNTKFFIQLKISPSRWERQNLIKSKEYFLFEGENMALLMLLCSDANVLQNHNIWADAVAYKSGAFIIHPQWNHQPDFINYQSFWANILDRDEGKKRIIVSLNWASRSKVSTDGREEVYIERTRSRIFRGKVMQKTPYFPRRSESGLHLHHEIRSSRTAWEVWHALPMNEHAYLLELCRPFENTTEAEQSHDYGIRRSLYLKFDTPENTFENSFPENLCIPFWEECENHGLLAEEHRELDILTICHLEFLCNGILMNKYSDWLNKDITCRIPTGILTCVNPECNSCSYRDQSCHQERNGWGDQIQYIVQCIKVFYQYSQGERDFSCKIIPQKRYPINIINQSNKSCGWLFHGMGFPASHLERKIGVILNQNLKRERGNFDLFMVGIIEPINVERIYNQPSDITRPNLSSSQNRQENPIHYQNLIVHELS